MSALDEIKSYMQLWGWTDRGGPGSVKLGLKGEVLAKHGDANWMRDVDNACNTINRIADRVECGDRPTMPNASTA